MPSKCPWPEPCPSPRLPPGSASTASSRQLPCDPLSLSAHHSTAEVASPSFTAFPWVLLATLTLGVQEKCRGDDELSHLEGKESYETGGGALKDQGPVQATQSPSKREQRDITGPSEGVHLTPSSLCASSLFCEDPHCSIHLHLKKLRPRTGRGLTKSHSYLPHPQHPQLALLLSFHLHTWGVPSKSEEDKNELIWLHPWDNLAEKPPSLVAALH